ncbi:MAG: hypothetical protein ABSE45_01410 [Candidatus Acidiferrales bacterium]
MFPSRPGGFAEKPAAGAKPFKSATADQERRHGQRVLLRIRTRIHVAMEGASTTLEATTLSVNPRGALVVIKKNLPLETRLVLEHSGTRERVACKVARTPREMPEGFHTPLEFDSPAPDFWKIAFPPADWRSEDL